ncbi:MAG: energy transducer TonB [Deltaproteobacteria bacterium]|nr:energy transducer TonB [Deltaproteobacteria bacterium]
MGRAPSRGPGGLADGQRPGGPPADKVPAHGGGEGAVSSSYRGTARGLIEQHKEYPAFARKAGHQGTCVVRFVLARSGTVEEVAVSRSSGRQTLDDAACAAVRRVGRFPAVPDDIEGDRVTLEVPISFRLGRE